MTDPMVRETLQRFLGEDLGWGDVTTEAVVPAGLRARAAVVCKERAVLAGVDEAACLAEIAGVELKPRKRDGDVLEKGDVVFEASGRAQAILKVERTLLNLIGHMSGVATATRDAVSKAKRSRRNVRVAATRKTLPGLRYFEKKAVMIGGGDPHRLDLSSMILVKDNHIKAAGSVESAVESARRAASFTTKVEVEAGSLKEALVAASSGADVVMLDNFTPDAVREAVSELKARGLRGKVMLEASGGIDLENIVEYAASGVDIISLGMITDSARSIDFSLEVTGLER